MKASKESSSPLCPSGDVPPSATRWGVSGVASRVSDPARVSGGPRCGAPPGVLASARSARFARGAALARSAAEGRWRPSSHSVSGVGPLGSAPGRPAANASSLPCAASCGGSALCIGGRSAPPPGSHICVCVGVRFGGPLHFFRAHRGLLALRLGRRCRPFGVIVRRLRCPPGVAFRHGRWLMSVPRARGLWGARRGGGACRIRAGARAGGWATGR